MSAAAEPLGLEPMPEHISIAAAGAGGSMGSAGAGAGVRAGNSSTTATGAVSATAAGVVDYMSRMRALWLGQAPQATSSSSGVSADAGSSSGGHAQGAGSSVSISMNERRMVNSLRPTYQWGALSGASTWEVVG